MKILKNTSMLKTDSRIDSAILEIMPEIGLNFTRSKIQKMIEEGNIRVNSKTVKPSYKLKTDDIIEIDDKIDTKNPITPENIELDIVYEDDYLIIINKQKGLLAHPTPLNTTGTLVNALIYYSNKTGCTLSDIQGQERLGIVHRLDKNTSGLIMVAKTNEAHLNLQKQLQLKGNGGIERKYLAVVMGNIEEDNGIIDKPLLHYMNKTVKMYVSNKGQEAVTLYKVLERYGDLTLLELELKTGRTHQIRCHLSSINHPVYGDTLYGAKGFKSSINLKTKEQLLISYYLKLKHPKTGDIMEFKLDEAQYDKDFKRFFEIIRRR